MTKHVTGTSGGGRRRERVRQEEETKRGRGYIVETEDMSEEIEVTAGVFNRSPDLERRINARGKQRSLRELTSITEVQLTNLPE